MVRKIKPKCGIIDLDDTFNYFTRFLCHLHNELNDTCISETDITDWNFENLNLVDVRGNTVTGKELMNTFLKYEKAGLYSCLPVIEESKRAVNLMRLLGYKIIFLTARKEEYRAATELNLIANDIIYDGVYFNKDKVQEIKRLKKTYNVQLFVDDHFDNVANVAENCRINHVFLINKEHNKNFEEGEDVIRINNLFDSVRYLKDLT